MSTLTQMTEMLGGIVTRRVDSKLYDWIRAISLIADNVSGGTQAEVRYVNTAGNDATGDGSFDNPFLTIQAAITSITDATAAKPYAILVSPGIYASAFVMQPWMFVVGTGRNTTVLVNPTANWIGNGFAAAGAQDAGIINCTVRTNSLVVDFSAAPSASGRFFFYDSLLDGAGWTVTGNGTTTGNTFFAQNIHQIQAGVFNATMTNCPLELATSELWNTNVNITYNIAAGVLLVRIGGVSCGRTFTFTCNDPANFMSVVGHIWSTIQAPIVIVGSGIVINGRGLIYSLLLADADQTLSLGTPIAAGVVAANEGQNLFTMTPTANRTLTLNDNGNATTRFRITNNSTAFVITLAGSLAGLPQSYIAPQGVLEVWRENNLWRAQAVIQSGVVTLVNGVSPNITADVSASSRIVATIKTVSGAFGTPVCGGRVNGTKAGGGLFVITSALPSTGATVATDQSTYDWHVYNS